jgi:hypothetical protein
MYCKLLILFCKLEVQVDLSAEVDIITHLAVCASQDWNKVGRIVVGDFVMASQAQRKWYTQVLEKLLGGGYRLGAVCVFFCLHSFPLCMCVVDVS